MSLGADLRTEMEITYELWLDEMALKLDYRCSLIDRGIWETANGEQVCITDMTYFHLTNTIAMLKRWREIPISDWTESFADYALPVMQRELDRRRQNFFTKQN